MQSPVLEALIPSALAAAWLNLIFGVMRVVNFAHGDLMILGAYSAFWLYDLAGLNPIIALLITMPLLMPRLHQLFQGMIGVSVAVLR